MQLLQSQVRYLCMHKPYADAVSENAIHVKMLEHRFLATQLKPGPIVCEFFV